MRHGLILICCLTLGSCQVRPTAFMPSSSIDYPGLKREPVLTVPESPVINDQPRVIPGEISTISPESLAVNEVQVLPQPSPEVRFYREAIQPDSIPDRRKTEPMGAIGAAAATTAVAGLLGNYNLYHINPVILLILLAAGASLGIASLVRIGDQPRKYKGRFWGWLSVFLASLPILFFILMGLSYK